MMVSDRREPLLRTRIEAFVRRHPLDVVLPVGLFVIALALYGSTMTSGLGGGIDSAELQHAAYDLSIVHPTGYPLYLLLARAFIWLVPFGEVAWRVTLLSAVFGALAVVAVYAIAMVLGRSRAGGMLAAGLMATHPLVWQQATIAEVNSLNLLLVATLVLTLVLWAREREPSERWQPPLELSGLLFGLALANHRVSLLALPGILIFLLWSAMARRRPNLRTLIRTVGAALLPLLLYLYIPLRAGTTPWYTNTWDNFWIQVSGESAWPVIQETLRQPLLPRVRLVVETVFGELRPGAVRDGTINGLMQLGGLGLLAITIVRWWGVSLIRRSVVGLLAPTAALVGGVMVVYDVDVIGDYLSMVALITAILASVGFVEGVRWLSPAVSTHFTSGTEGERHRVDVTQVAAWVLVFAVLAWHGWSIEPEMDRSHDDSARAFWNAVQDMEGTPAALGNDALLIGSWNRVNELRYLQSVEGWRPDLQPVLTDDLVHTGRLGLIDEWLGQDRPVNLLEGVPAILDQFRVERQGPTWSITGRSELQPPVMEHPVNVRFGEAIELLGYTLEPEQVRAGDALRITLFWQAATPITERYVVFAHLIDDTNHKIGQRDDEPGSGERPTTAWVPGEMVTDSLVMVVDPAATPGTYKLVIGMYARVGEQRLPVHAPDGTRFGDVWQMTTISLLP